MKKNTLFILLLTLFSFCFQFKAFAQEKKVESDLIFGQPKNLEEIARTNGFIRCASTEYEKYLQQTDPKRMTDQEFERWLEPLVEKYKLEQMTSSQNGTIITIPVVVHVIHAGQDVGIAPNISDAQVQSQITVLNNDLRRLAGTPGFNSNVVGADIEIQFALAKQDPFGNPTNGIDRVNFCQESYTRDEIQATVKPTTTWDPTLYLNMWSISFTQSDLLGYAQFPNASGLPGLNASGGSASTDGVVVTYSSFGAAAYNDGTFILNAPYNQGRTMTHEVGHWLGLRHIWGDSNCGTDFCADTPIATTSNAGCPVVASCPPSVGNAMIQNYMDYTNDTCMNIFTIDQKFRMRTIIDNAARRASLKTSTKDLNIPLFANDAEINVERSCAGGISTSCAGGSAKKLTISNRGTATLTTATINYSLDGGAMQSYDWTGNLAPNKSNTFEVPINAAADGTISASIALVNGTTDERTTNDSADGDFVVQAPAPNVPATAFQFKLQRDTKGSEITWNIKNSSGTILYQGGPYTNSTNLPPVTNLNWTLPSGNCYTFTINDTGNNGICCTNGNGYYQIKNGANIIVNGASFSNTEKKVLTNFALSTTDFEQSNEIFVYPNPSTGVLNIKVPYNFGLPTKYVITNSLGQIMEDKTIVSDSDLTFSTSRFSDGIYFLTLFKDNAKRSMRFIKN
jgi:hypothetical protein